MRVSKIQKIFRAKGLKVTQLDRMREYLDDDVTGLLYSSFREWEIQKNVDELNSADWRHRERIGLFVLESKQSDVQTGVIVLQRMTGRDAEGRLRMFLWEQARYGAAEEKGGRKDLAQEPKPKATNEMPAELLSTDADARETARNNLRFTAVIN